MMKMCLKTRGKVTHLVVHDDVCGPVVESVMIWSFGLGRDIRKSVSTVLSCFGTCEACVCMKRDFRWKR